MCFALYIVECLAVLSRLQIGVGVSSVVRCLAIRETWPIAVFT